MEPETCRAPSAHVPAWASALERVCSGPALAAHHVLRQPLLPQRFPAASHKHQNFQSTKAVWPFPGHAARFQHGAEGSFLQPPCENQRAQIFLTRNSFIHHRGADRDCWSVCGPGSLMITKPPVSVISYVRTSPEKASITFLLSPGQECDLRKQPVRLEHRQIFQGKMESTPQTFLALRQPGKTRSLPLPEA